jgi:hypothetical protein
VGVKLTQIVQLVPAAIPVPQLLVCAKSPSADMVEILSSRFPVLLNVTNCGALDLPMLSPPKVKLPGDKPTVGAMPEPLRAKACELVEILSVRIMLPVRLPVAVGLKVTLTTQWAPAAITSPQLLVCVKSPTAATFEIFSGALPMLVIVTSRDALATPTSSGDKVSASGYSEIWGALSSPLRKGVSPATWLLIITSGMPSELKSPTKVAAGV